MRDFRSKKNSKTTRRPLIPIEGRQQDSLRVFHEVARALTSNLELNPLLRAILGQLEEFFGPEHWSLLMVDDETAELYFAMTAGHDEAELSSLRLQPGEGIAGYVATTGIPLVVSDVSLDLEWSRYAAEHPELNLKSIACLPIRHGGRTLGVLQLNNSELNLMPESSVAFLRVLCDYAAIALANARQVRLIRHLTITDDCTGLFNARHLYTLLEEEMAAAVEAESSRVITMGGNHFSLLFLDLDHFKNINDVHGHLVGSRLLAEIGNLLKRTLGPEHAAFRYGGDEFVALLRGMDKPAATACARNVLESITDARFLAGDGLSLEMTASLGLATYPQDGETLAEMIKVSDTMMYVAKADGRNRLVVADSNAPVMQPVPKTSRHS